MNQVQIEIKIIHNVVILVIVKHLIKEKYSHHLLEENLLINKN